jgi:hypothetical protein
MRNNTGHTRKNGAISKVVKKIISHPTRAKRTLPAAGTMQVSHALPVWFRNYIILVWCGFL